MKTALESPEGEKGVRQQEKVKEESMADEDEELQPSRPHARARERDGDESRDERKLQFRQFLEHQSNGVPHVVPNCKTRE